MCDTMVSLTDDGVLFAKNSDRDPNEAQVLEWVPGAEHRPGARVRCTWHHIPQVRRTHAVLLSRPWWMWGAEMGANEHGVVIGNEAVFTRRAQPDGELLGMDLVRLGLERGDDAAGAVGAIVELLEAHGQGGAASRAHPGFSYDNSFIVADRHSAIVLETAGRSWAVEYVHHGARSISNELTIPGFASAHSDRLRSKVAAATVRRRRTTHDAAAARNVVDLMTSLRSHGVGLDPRYSPLNGGMSQTCMHAGGLVTNAQTTASWVADLSGSGPTGAGPTAAGQHWATATAAPCTSLFKPVHVSSPVDLGVSPTDVADGRSVWWRHERLHRATMRDPGAMLARYAHERDRVQRAWVTSPPDTATAFALADELEARWAADVIAADGPDRRPPLVRRYWGRQDRAAGVDPGRVVPAGTDP